MKLLSIQIVQLGSKGWSSDLLEFGDHVTQLFGPNGCGKTPIVQSIAYCLGFPSVFRKDIYEQCKYTTLKIDTSKGHLTIKRTYSRGVDIEVIEPNGTTQKFYNELDYSLYLFELLDLKVNNLITNKNKATKAYLSSMLPIFYLDQDEGYSKIYCPPSSFIKDQFSEMLRLIFDLPVKNSFDAKKEKISAQEELDFLDKSVEVASRRLDAARLNTSTFSKTSEQLKDEINNYKGELEALKNSGITHDESILAFDRVIASQNKLIRSISDEISEINKRTKGIGQIIHEINTEIETLNLNEEARRVFLSFNEICGAAACQLFSSSSDSYSKNLLYLKDQIKDLERNAHTDNIKIEQLKEQKTQLKDSIAYIIDERNRSLEKSEVSALVDAISELKNQIFELQNQLSDVEKIEALENRHLELTKKRNKAYEKVQSFTSGKSTLPLLVKLKANLRALFLNWLEIIHTSNISRDITFSDDFTPVLGGETISQLKGSTRIRAVLAYHAALIELMAQFGRLSFKFLILDTPKQHEIDSNDLDRYLKALKKLCSEYDIQIIFSTTEYHYEGDQNDAEWVPRFPGKEQKMFLHSLDR